MAIKDKTFALFLLAPVVGFYRWVIIDNGTSIGSMWITFGKPFSDMPSFDYVLQQFLSPFIIRSGINSLFIVLYILLIVYILNKQTDIPFIKYITLNRAISALVLIYAAFFTFDLCYRGNLLRLTNVNYHGTQEEKLTIKPIKIVAINPEKKALTGIDIQLSRNNIKKHDYIQLIIKDVSGKTLDVKRISDFDVPVNYGDYFIPFNKAISLEKFNIYISKVYGQNTILIKTAESKSIPELVNQGYMDYDAYYKSNQLDISFPEKMYVTNLRGRFSVKSMTTNLLYHIKQKPSFYLGFFSLLGISLTGAVVLIVQNRKDFSV